MSDQGYIQADARNRSIRTLLQNLAFDVLVAIAMVILPIFTSASAWSDINWQLLGFLVFKSIIVSVFTYLTRTVVDPSRVKTPIPAPLPAPVAPVPDPPPEEQA